MATGRSNQLTKQVGEYLVAAELARLGLIASTFAGSVPDYGIIATDSAFRGLQIEPLPEQESDPLGRDLPLVVFSVAVGGKIRNFVDREAAV